MGDGCGKSLDREEYNLSTFYMGWKPNNFIKIHSMKIKLNLVHKVGSNFIT